MKTKNILIVLLLTFLSLVGFGIYKLATYNIFDEEFKSVEDIVVSGKTYAIKVYYIPSNASSQSYIQIRKIENREEEVLQNYENFNYFKFNSIKRDTLIFTLGDTSKVNRSLEDRILVLP